MSSRTEYLYKLYAVREKKKILSKFIYEQCLHIESLAEKIKKGEDTLGNSEEILNLCESIRAFSEEMG